MRTTRWNRAYIGLVLSLLLFVGGAFAISAAFGMRINTTSSMPIGVYRISHAAISRGSYVSVCLPPSNSMTELMRIRGYEHAGTCDTGLAPLIKPVVAIAGDTIELTDNAVIVNGRVLANSRTASRDSEGKKLPAWPRGTYQVPPGMAWLVSNFSANSLDSRYFGPVPSASIEHVLTRLY